MARLKFKISLNILTFAQICPKQGRDSQNFVYFLTYVKKLTNVLSEKKNLKNVLFTKNLKIFLKFELKKVLSKKNTSFLKI